MSDKKRATFDELLEFANKVREAGGGNPLDALMPAVPRSPRECLIAKNLNFNCSVTLLMNEQYQGRWVMRVNDAETQEAISDKLGLTKIDCYSKSKLKYGIVLPEEIGLAAESFDQWSLVINSEWREGEGTLTHVVMDDDLDFFNEFLPYIDTDYVKIAYGNIVNERDEQIL